jgi:hypothetical protein
VHRSSFLLHPSASFRFNSSLSLCAGYYCVGTIFEYACPAGRFSSLTNLTSADECTFCPLGKIEINSWDEGWATEEDACMPGCFAAPTANAGPGFCDGVLNEGQTCNLHCMPGYVVSGPSDCTGVFHGAPCDSGVTACGAAGSTYDPRLTVSLREASFEADNQLATLGNAIALSGDGHTIAVAGVHDTDDQGGQKGGIA